MDGSAALCFAFVIATFFFPRPPARSSLGGSPDRISAEPALPARVPAEAGRRRAAAGRTLALGLRSYPERMRGECVERGESFVGVVIIPSCETRPRLHEGF